jgi:hypothetical protein
MKVSASLHGLHPGAVHVVLTCTGRLDINRRGSYRSGGYAHVTRLDTRSMMSVAVPEQPSANLEDALARVERASLAAQTAAANLVKSCKDVVKAAAAGDLGRLHKNLERLTSVSQIAAQQIANAAASWQMSIEDEEGYLRSGYDDELIRTAGVAGIDLRRLAGRLVASPSVLQVLPAQRVLRVDRKRIATIRPSVVVAILKEAAMAKPKQTPERFIEILYAAYKLVTGGDRGGTGTNLAAVYEALTLFPDVRREYGPAEFARDLYELDRSGVKETKDGARVALPAATGTKGGSKLFNFVSPDGEPVTYYAIRFIQ